MSAIGELTSSPVITRYPQNPVLSSQDVPYDASLIFNAGVVKQDGRYVMAFRNDYGFDSSGKHKTNMGLAYSDDGIAWQVEPEPIFPVELLGLSDARRAYDPRLMRLEGRWALTFATDTDHGVRAGIALTGDFKTWQIKHISLPENRNVVLFPRKINGKYMRLDRPFPIYSRPEPEAFDIWLSVSPDLVYWGESKLLLGVEDVPFSNRKIGPGAPPIELDEGWLVFFHAVDWDDSRGKNGWEDAWKKRYTAGVMLLDKDDPTRILGMYDKPLIAPEAPYETQEGFRTNVIFPTGAVLEDDGDVKIYYGAADTVIALATANVRDLVGLCLDSTNYG